MFLWYENCGPKQQPGLWTLLDYCFVSIKCHCMIHTSEEPEDLSQSCSVQVLCDLSIHNSAPHPDMRAFPTELRKIVTGICCLYRWYRRDSSIRDEGLHQPGRPGLWCCFRASRNSELGFTRKSAWRNRVSHQVRPFVLVYGLKFNLQKPILY